MISKLCIFDFDGTLFRSPERPSWWAPIGWWTDPRSLMPPCVPVHPDADWWIESTVTAAESRLSETDTLTVLLTGRPADRFTLRLHELLDQTSLRFHEVTLCDADESIAWKAQRLRHYLAEHPDVRVTEAWDDRPEQFAAFQAVAAEYGVKLVSHLVTVEAHAVACLAPEGVGARSTSDAVLARFLARMG